ncbi:MAG TPA: ABA4-like family protein, partial [Rhizobiaceae bacterium]|nr:ABA4-like family protein [Rhizobiaceae bacterium]
MNPDSLFQLANTTALGSWVVLLASPFASKLTDAISGYVIPLALSVVYTALILAFWSGAQGGFDTLDNVMLLFTSREVALAGWVHYLAFDLFVGAWEARTARRESIPFLLVVPCLVLTFLFGPIGLLAFHGL